MDEKNGNGERDLSKIIERIQKLLALTESANEHEAGVAAAKAAELLAKYELSMATVEGHMRPDAPEIVEDRSPYIGSKGMRSVWEVDLAGAVADANRCKILISKVRIHWIGTPSAVQVSAYMHTQLATRLNIMASAATRAYIAKAKAEWEADEFYGETAFHHTLMGRMYGPGGTTRAYRNSWLQGAVGGVSHQLYEQRRAFEESSANAKALIVVTGVALEEYMKSLHTSGPWSGRNSFGAGFIEGSQAGSSMSIHSGLTGGGGNKQIGR